MAISTSSYETTVQINSFSGIYQGEGERGVSMKYAVDGENFDTTGGMLRSMDGGRVHVNAALPHPIGTLMLLYRRFWRTGYSGEPELLVAACGDSIYIRSLRSDADVQWEKVYTGITNDRFDYVTYETSTYWVVPGHMEDGRVPPYATGAEEISAENPIDILIMSNAEDGMLVLYGDTLEVMRFTVKPSTTDVEKKFGVLTRHAERIWGAAIPDQPDMLMYSTPFEPLNWEQNDEHPEGGAGDIQQPSWDGDGFVALRTYGSYLLGIKKNRIWRITGTNPGEYYFKEQFGGGTIVENTVVVYNDTMFLLSYDGLMIYDGTSVQPFRQNYVQEIMARVNQDSIEGSVAAMRGEIYCLALPLDGSACNNAILEYDTHEHTFNLRYGVYASSFLPYENKLYYTDSRAETDAQSGAVMVLDGSGDALPMRYVTAYQDLGYKSVVKNGFEVYLTSDSDMQLEVAIQTEKKRKARTVALTAGKARRVRLNASGRYFRLELSADPGRAWRLSGGIQINMELDSD